MWQLFAEAPVNNVEKLVQTAEQSKEALQSSFERMWSQVVDFTPKAIAAVVETSPPARKAGPAAPGLAAQVRRAALAAGVSVAAVLVVPAQPTDIRHNAKIGREALAAWAARRPLQDRA